MNQIHLCTGDICLTCQSVAKLRCSYKDRVNQECCQCDVCPFWENGILSSSHLQLYHMKQIFSPDMACVWSTWWESLTCLVLSLSLSPNDDHLRKGDEYLCGSSRKAATLKIKKLNLTNVLKNRIEKYQDVAETYVHTIQNTA